MQSITEKSDAQLSFYQQGQLHSVSISTCTVAEFHRWAASVFPFFELDDAEAGSVKIRKQILAAVIRANSSKLFEMQGPVPWQITPPEDKNLVV